MNFTPKKTQKGLAIERLAQTLSIADRRADVKEARADSSLLANTNNTMKGNSTNFYSTIKPMASGGFTVPSEKPLSMWDKMTLYDLQKKQAEDLAST